MFTIYTFSLDKLLLILYNNTFQKNVTKKRNCRKLRRAGNILKFAFFGKRSLSIIMTVYSFDLEKCSKTVEGSNQWERWPVTPSLKEAVLRITVDVSSSDIKIWNMSPLNKETHVGK
jgi:hypothetical protein